MPKGVYERKTIPLEDRFWAKVEKTDTCWLWTGATYLGYGVFGVGGGKTIRAYKFLVGIAPDGKEWDHRCHAVDESCQGGADCQHRRCVRPSHLRSVTHAENMRYVRWAESKKTACPRGHLYSGDNLIINSKGRRECRTCTRERSTLRRMETKKQMESEKE